MMTIISLLMDAFGQSTTLTLPIPELFSQGIGWTIEMKPEIDCRFVMSYDNWAKTKIRSSCKNPGFISMEKNPLKDGEPHQCIIGSKIVIFSKSPRFIIGIHIILYKPSRRRINGRGASLTKCARKKWKGRKNYFINPQCILVCINWRGS